ncbi:hypothetical protein ACYPKM_04835 [Pseudomonas aeruginosa]
MRHNRISPKGNAIHHDEAGLASKLAKRLQAHMHAWGWPEMRREYVEHQQASEQPFGLLKDFLALANNMGYKGMERPSKAVDEARKDLLRAQELFEALPSVVWELNDHIDGGKALEPAEEWAVIFELLDDFDSLSPMISETVIVNMIRLSDWALRIAAHLEDKDRRKEIEAARKLEEPVNVQEPSEHWGVSASGYAAEKFVLVQLQDRFAEQARVALSLDEATVMANEILAVVEKLKKGEQ